MSGNAAFPSKKIQSSLLIFLVVINLILPDLCRAASISKQESDVPDTHAQTTPPVVTVVSATRREMPIEESTRFVTVITQDEIKKSGKVYIIDLIRGMPGVAVTQQGSQGRTTSIFMRGTNSNHVMLLVDGVEVNNPGLGTADLSSATVENFVATQDIDRIEILRGPQSVLYGSNALAGVINIITRAGTKPDWHGNARFEYGTHETFYETAGLNGQWKRFSFASNASRIDSQGPGENDQYANTGAFAHGTYQVSDRSDLDFVYHHCTALTGIEDGSFDQDPNANSRSHQDIVALKYNLGLIDWWQQSLKYSFLDDSLFSIDPRDPGAAGADPEFSPFRSITDQHEIEYQSNLYLGDIDVVTFGYSFEDGRVRTKTLDRTFVNHAWFGQNELKLWDWWTIVAGARLDRHEVFGTEVSPLVSTGFWIEPTQTKLKGSLGKGFRAPTFSQMASNPDVLPEKSWGSDVGFEQFYWGKRASFSAAYFHNRIENLIQSVFTGGRFVPQNIGKARTHGVELEHKIQLMEKMNLYANYTYTEAIDRATKNRLIRRPWHQGKISFSYDFWKAHFYTDWLWVGPREDQSFAAGRPSRERNHGYNRLDLALFYDVTQFFQVYGRIENALNTEYSEVIGFENPTTRFVVGTKAEF